MMNVWGFFAPKIYIYKFHCKIIIKILDSDPPVEYDFFFVATIKVGDSMISEFTY